MSIDRTPQRRRRWQLLLMAPALLTAAVLTPAQAAPVAAAGASPAADASPVDGWQFADTGVARFHYRKAGEGPPIVLLPGGSLWSYTYRDLIPALAARHTVYAVDLPGSGYTTLHDPDFRFDVPAMTEALRQFLDAVGLTRTSVLAHSLSGSVAVDFAARYPDRVDRLALLAPLVLDTTLNTKMQLMRLPVAGELATSVLTEDIYRAGLRDAYAHPELLTDELAQRYWDPLSRPENRLAMWKQPRNLDLAAVQVEAGAVRADTLLIWGDHDHVVDPAQGAPLRARMSAARLRIVAGAGHNVHEDDPAAVAAALTEFLDTP